MAVNGSPVNIATWLSEANRIGNATHGKEYMEAVENFIARFD